MGRLQHAALALALLFAALSLAQPGTAQERKALKGVALVIGEGQYEHLAALPNPANDARAVVKLLTDLGFDARAATDRDAKKLRRDLERFAEDAEEADVALLYYSGHGIEAGGENWLVPVDADVGSLDQAEEALVAVSPVLDQLKASVPVTIVLLDACRSSPFPKGATIRQAPEAAPEPVGGQGLTPVRGAAPLVGNRPKTENLGIVVGFAAEPGRAALDGAPGSNSPYAAALLRHFSAMGGVEFGQVMRMVTEEVYLDTSAKQRPWVNESLRRLLYFGLAPEQAGGVDGDITRERRQLLLTMADLAGPERVQVEQVAARERVRLDALYGVLKAFGAEPPRDPKQLDDLLQAQAGRLRTMMAQKAALRTDDPEIASLSASADRAVDQGAIGVARKLLDRAVARIEADAPVVDDLEAQVKAKRLADASVYARRAEASALAFAFRDAARDYAKAYDLVARWDERLAWNYKNMQAEALSSLGQARSDRIALAEALDAYQAVLDMVPNGVENRDWAITRNNQALVLYALGKLDSDNARLLEAREVFEKAMTVFAREKDDKNWAAAMNNSGNILLELGERTGERTRFEEAKSAFEAALARRDRAKVPLDWASTQNNIGLVEYQMAEPRGDAAGLRRAEGAYRAALEVFTRDRTPTDWALVENNLGNTLNALGLLGNDPALNRQAAEAFEAAMTVRTKSDWPQQWATSQLNYGNAWNAIGRFEVGTDSIDKAAEAYRRALTVFDRANAPLDWASAQNNLGAVLQTAGQRTRNMDRLRESVAAFTAAREVYAREKFPNDWAMTHNNAGNTLHLMSVVSGEADWERQAIAAYAQALQVYSRGKTPMQWALATASMGNALQTLANYETGTESLEGAITAREQALEVLTPENAPVEWANAQNGLGTSLLNLATRGGDRSGLGRAEKAFEAAAKVLTQDAQPVQWAFLQNNIGDVHWSLAGPAGDKDELRLALERFETARKTFAGQGISQVVELLDQKIAVVRKSLQ